MNQYCGGQYLRKVGKTFARLRNECKGQFRLVKIVVILAVAVIVVGYVGISTLIKREPLTRMSSGSHQPNQEGVITNSIGMKLVYIPAGSFMMGSPPNEKGHQSHEGPQHQVEISKAFWMGQTEVTQAQWWALMGTTVGQERDKENPYWPLTGKSADYPMYCVSWYDAVEFCRRLGQRENRTYRLPTEAEWEYACRAGSVGRFTFGDSESSLGDYAWCPANSSGSARPVRQKQPNAFGLYDMHGNVLEWCSDWYGWNYYLSSPSADPQGPPSGYARVLRGGCWYDGDPEYCRSALRHYNPPDYRNWANGFRVVLLDFQ